MSDPASAPPLGVEIEICRKNLSALVSVSPQWTDTARQALRTVARLEAALATAQQEREALETIRRYVLDTLYASPPDLSRAGWEHIAAIAQRGLGESSHE